MHICRHHDKWDTSCLDMEQFRELTHTPDVVKRLRNRKSDTRFIFVPGHLLSVASVSVLK